MTNLTELVDWIQSRAPERTTIGIDGFGGSGKSTLAGSISALVAQSEVVAYDDLYLPNAIQPDFASSTVGIADAYDWEALRDGLLRPFRQGLPGSYPVLDWISQERSVRILSPATRVLLVEGVSCTRPELRNLYDFRIWVTAPYETRLARGVERDGEAMRSHWADVWMPAEQAYQRACQPDHSSDLNVDGTAEIWIQGKLRPSSDPASSD